MKMFKAPQVALAISLTALFTAGCANNGTQEETTSLVTITEASPELQKVGYSYGYAMAMSNKEIINDLDLDAFETGFRDAYADRESPLTQEQMEELLVAYETRRVEELRQEAMDDRQGMAESNLTTADEYLTNNLAQAGVQATESGLQYRVIEPGTGASPSLTDSVLVNYEGKLIDGTIFDSSYQRDQPQQFNVQETIPGFTEGLMLMQKGSKYEFYIPPALAYGEAGKRGIEPNSLLIFTVELIEINP